MKRHVGQQTDIVVQQSFPDPRPTTNPYVVMLRDALAETPGVAVQTFGWGRALLSRYDVFHVHWPEILVTGSTPLKTVLRQLMVTFLLLRLRITRTPVVRTQHNLNLPTGLSRVQRVLLRRIDRQTAFRIALNPETTFAPGTAAGVIPHGHYRDWFARYPHAGSRTFSFGYFGLIRRYKNVEALLEAFARLPGDDLTLRVAGKPSSPDLAGALTRLSSDDPRVRLSLDFLSDADLVEVATGCELVVLPYTHMHNSGGVLASLSLGTPVLVPANAANRALAEEVGLDWVLTYEEALDESDLAAALALVRSGGRSPEPDLSRRGWQETGARHLAAYRAALVSAGRRYSR